MADVKNKDFLTKVNIGAGILFIIVLIIVKVNNPNFSLASFWKWLLLGTLGFAIIGGLLYYLLGKNSNQGPVKGELPPAITFHQARELVKKSLADPMYMDEIDLVKKEDEGVEEIGKPPSKVYIFVGRGKYSNDRYAIGINMHYPDTMYRILTNPKTDYAITQMKQKLASYPAIEPNVTTTIAKNPILGTEVVTTETKHPDSENKKEKADELDKKE